MFAKDLTKLKANAWSKDLFSILLGSFLLAIFANISIPLPFTPVPIVTQNFIAILIGIVLGPKRGALSILAFFAQGAAGLPVFAKMTSGYEMFVGPTGGYLVGYLFSAVLAGYVAKKKTSLNLLLAMALGVGCQYTLGLAQLAYFVGFKNVLALGFYPFIVGDLLKMAVSHQVLSFLSKKS